MILIESDEVDLEMNRSSDLYLLDLRSLIIVAYFDVKMAIIDVQMFADKETLVVQAKSNSFYLFKIPIGIEFNDFCHSKPLLIEPNLIIESFSTIYSSQRILMCVAKHSNYFGLIMKNEKVGYLAQIYYLENIYNVRI